MSTAKPDEAAYRIGVDIGGTFTDVVLWDMVRTCTRKTKLLTTPDDPSRAVMDGITGILAQRGIEPRAVDAVIHGTTLVANALIERKGVKTGLITTRGYRDVLEIGREWRYDLFDLEIEMPSPIAGRPARQEITERIGPNGAVITGVELGELADIAKTFEELGVESVGVCLLHSYRNPAHEIVVGKRLAEIAPNLSISLSSTVSPEMGEYERSSTIVANAYVHTIFKTYVERLADGLSHMGFSRDLLLILSDGRLVKQDTATQFPIRLVQSGPAAGAQAAVLYGALSEAEDLLCFDMGGTTAKVCLIEHGEPKRSATFEVARVFRFAEGSGLPLQIPAIDMIEIGAGGGSIARVDRLGLIQVGPDSASAMPGPVCYGLGGEDPTVTDADLVLGYLDPGRFLGGEMRLDRGGAAMTIEKRLAEPLGISMEAAAWGVHETVTGNMAQAAAIHAIEKGLNVEKFTMVPIGGAGPVHVCAMARKMGIDRLICPVGAGVASAVGMLGAPISFEVSQAHMSHLDTVDWPEVTQMVNRMAAQGEELVRHAGVALNDITINVTIMMRYVGQGYEVEVPVDRSWMSYGNADAVAQSFAESYRRRFNRTEAMPAETISWRVVTSGPRPALGNTLRSDATASDGTARRGSRPVWFGLDKSYLDTPVYNRSVLAVGTEIEGPAILE
ncbi:MAG: hydantoinase/oxoprolinase family protein, partial [Alphaproteobacteria bacterium]